jgi:hypothetical protein
MKKITFLVLVTLLITTACEPSMKYRSIDTFEISENLINNLDEVELIYSTGTPKGNGFNAFLHVMAIHKTSGDTVNVLTTNNSGTGKGDKKNLFKFYTPSSDEGKNYFSKTHNLDGELSVSTLENINQVLYDPRFNFMTQNNFPAVIGFLDK